MISRFFFLFTLGSGGLQINLLYQKPDLQQQAAKSHFLCDCCICPLKTLRSCNAHHLAAAYLSISLTAYLDKRKMRQNVALERP